MAAQETKFKLEETKGDLFLKSHPDASLAHCVSECLSMSKGIAVEFKKRFGCVEQLKAQAAKIGGVAVLPLPSSFQTTQKESKRRFVFYLVTKGKYYQTPTYEALTLSIRAMRDLCGKYGIQHLCLPRIGCGLDGLSWSRVREILQAEFAATNCKIEVFSL